MLKMDTTTVKYLCIVVIIGASCHLTEGHECVQSTRAASFRLTCPHPRDKIVQVNMTAGVGICHRPERTDCHGDPASLLVSNNNCYWNPNCTVDFPLDPIIRVPEGQETCFGRVPKFMGLQEYRCFTPIPNEPNNGNLLDVCGGHNSNAYSHGLIRSHDYYPWMYEPNELRRKSCSVVIFRLIKAKTLQKLAFDVLDIELGEDDTVTLIEDGVKVPVTSSTSRRTSAGTVTVKFDVSQHSIGGRGFIFCFKFFGEHEHIDNACDEVTTRHQGGILSPVMASDESTLTAPPTTTKRAAALVTTPKPGPGCYNKKGKLKKKCRGKKPNKGKKGKKGKKKDKGKKDKKEKKRNKKRRHLES